ncbi:MAG: hypothetical protein LBN32_02000 [Helicobacteraceae bacterium]|jgi:Na+-translocating ferredoxin:NAD+ oxidoreductase RNF subunit RnfB|nr:hypothetical protein [Helicobacteraceae bacterium]
MKDFLLENVEEALGALLADDFALKADGSEALISNTAATAEVFAPEVNFFLAHTRSDIPTQARILRALYEARAIAYDRAETERKIVYDTKLCHYHEQIASSCSFCVQACPHEALATNDRSHHLQYAADRCDHRCENLTSYSTYVVVCIGCSGKRSKERLTSNNRLF